MIKEGIEKIVSLALEGAEKCVIEIDDRLYSTKNLNAVEPPHPNFLKVSTLSGIKSYIQGNIDEIDLSNSIIHIESPFKVSLISNLEKKFLNRSTYICAYFNSKWDMLNNWLPTESFIIFLLSAFTKTDQVNEILKIVGNIKTESVKNLSDDGFTQSVEARSGIAKVKNLSVNSQIFLRPYRTFPEIDQPESLFLLRLREKRNSKPECALFSADGDIWEVHAIQYIKEWFLKELPEMKIIA